MADNTGDSSSFIELTANIVSAYVSNNTVPSADVPNLISQVHAALKRVSGGQAAAPAEPLKPAVPVKESDRVEVYTCTVSGRVNSDISNDANSCTITLVTTDIPQLDAVVKAGG